MTVKAMKYGAALLLAALNAPAQALEFSPGDYEMLPDGQNLFLTYLQYSHSDAYYAQDQRVDANYKLKSDVTLLRFIHAFRPADNISIEPQAIVPFGRADAYGDASGLGSSSGIGDAIIGIPVKITPNARQDVFALAPFIYLPTGVYDQDKALNLGENRWRFLLQGVWIHHFSPHWAFDTGADVSWVTKNDDYAGQTLQQKPRYEYQAYLRYDFNPRTRVGFGGGWITGAESSLDGTPQHDRLNTTYARVSVAHFFTPSVQLLTVVGKDLKVEQRFKQDLNLTLRLGVLF